LLLDLARGGPDDRPYVALVIGDDELNRKSEKTAAGIKFADGDFSSLNRLPAKGSLSAAHWRRYPELNLARRAFCRTTFRSGLRQLK
jgi:hypothetical protein